jgi:hypothetical protein
MRIRHLFRIINWSAAGIAAVVIFLGKEQYYPWIVVAVLAAVSLHFLVETAALIRRLRFRHRFADTREFRGHRPFAVNDLEEALSSGTEVAGVTLPVVITGTVASSAEKKAPLSGKKAVAWRLVAEPLEGVGKVGGQVLTIDAWWPDLTVRDETGTVSLHGPGVLDGSSYVERVCSMATLRSDFPEIASRVADGLGIAEGKESKILRIALREIALCSKDKVTVYGSAQRSPDGLSLSGTDVLDDTGSLMVRASSRPASTRIPRRLAATVSFAVFSLLLLAGLVAFASSTVASTLTAPGGLLDASRTGDVKLDLDGRALRVTVGTSHWDLDAGESTKGYALSADSGTFKAARSSVLLIQEVHPSTVTIRNGDAGYPRWDGSAWMFEAGSAAGSPAGAAAPAPASTEPAHSGPLYIRNLTGFPVTVRVLNADNTPRADTTWDFAAYEAAKDPRGHYLEITGKGALQCPSDARVEITTSKGYQRILPLATAGRWDASAWRFELVPEYLAGRGNLYVKNTGGQPIRIWVIGADGKPLFGDDPWAFEPKEGTDKDRGLRLQYSDKNISMSGRELVKVETRQLTTVYQGPLERLASWKGGAWTVDMSKAAAKQ